MRFQETTATGRTAPIATLKRDPKPVKQNSTSDRFHPAPSLFSKYLGGVGAAPPRADVVWGRAPTRYTVRAAAPR